MGRKDKRRASAGVISQIKNRDVYTEVSDDCIERVVSDVLNSKTCNKIPFAVINEGNGWIDLYKSETFHKVFKKVVEKENMETNDIIGG